MLSTPFEFQIVFTPKPMHRTESTTLVLSLQKFPRTVVTRYVKETLAEREGFEPSIEVWPPLQFSECLSDF